MNCDQTDGRTDRAESMIMPFYRHESWLIYGTDKITKLDATSSIKIKQNSIRSYSIYGYGKGRLSQPRLSTISPIVSIIKEMLIYGREAQQRSSSQNRYGVFEYLATVKHVLNTLPIVTAQDVAFFHQDTNGRIEKCKSCVNYVLKPLITSMLA